MSILANGPTRPSKSPAASFIDMKGDTVIKFAILCFEANSIAGPVPMDLPMTEMLKWGTSRSLVRNSMILSESIRIWSALFSLEM